MTEHTNGHGLVKVYKIRSRDMESICLTQPVCFIAKNLKKIFVFVFVFVTPHSGKN